MTDVLEILEESTEESVDEISSGIIYNVSPTLRVRNDGANSWVIETRHLTLAGTVQKKGRGAGRTYEVDTWSKWGDPRYYPSLQSCLQRLLTLTMVDGGYTLATDDVQELIFAVKQAVGRLESVFEHYV